MKSIKVTIRFIVFSVLCLINTSLLAVNSNVDSISNAIVGTWYKVYEVSGMTGDLDSIYTSDSTVISRISATDSISWKQYKSGLLIYDLHYLISYSNSPIYKTDKWMLKSGENRLLVSVENYGFSYYLDAYDGGGAGYSPSVDSNVDFLCNALKGTWYKVFNYSGLTGVRDTIFNSDSTVIMRIPRTDSIAWKEYKNGLLTNDYKYLISYSNSFIYRSRKWMLKGGDIGHLISLNDYGFACFLDAIDGGGLGYSHTKISNGLSDNNVSKGRFKVIQNQNNLISIIGNTKLLKVAIYDLNGKKHKSWMNVESGQMMDVSDLHTGIYMVIIDADNEHNISRIVKN